MHVDVREDLRPELREIIVDDRDADEAGVHHLEDVVVVETLRGLEDRDRWAPASLEPQVECPQALGVTARSPDEDFQSGQVLDGFHDGHARRGHHDLADVAPDGNRKIHGLLPLRGHGLLRRDGIDLACDECRQEPVALHRHGDHVDAKIPGLARRVELRFEPLQVGECQTALRAPVHEIVGAVDGDADADHPARFHSVEITRKRAPEHGAQRLGKVRLVGERWQGLIDSRRGVGGSWRLRGSGGRLGHRGHRC